MGTPLKFRLFRGLNNVKHRSLNLPIELAYRWIIEQIISTLPTYFKYGLLYLDLQLYSFSTNSEINNTLPPQYLM